VVNPDGKSSSINTDPNDTLGLVLDGTNKRGVSVADGTNDSRLKQLSSECDVMGSIVVAILLPKGDEHYLETLDVEYEWWPPRCSKCKNFDHEDDSCPSKDKKASSDSLSGGFPKPNHVYQHVSKPITNKENTSKPNANAPYVSKEGVNGAVNEPNVSPKVMMNDSSGSINENGYFKDAIDLGQLRSNIEKLMDEDKVLDINTNNDMEGVVETKNSVPNIKEVSTNTKLVPAKVKGSDKGSLWEQFTKASEASMSKHKSSMSDTESDEDEVCMSDVIPGEGFLDGLEDDLDCYDSYEA
ncbi:hypothetical protein Tco_0448890, partial [Tanacetum coccineum]